MGKLKRPKWGALPAERKAHIHKLNRVRNSAGKVKQWLIDNGHKPERERKKMMRQFLEALGIYKEGIGINLQIEALYKDDKFTIIGRDTTMFYSTPEWLALRVRMLVEYGEVCMKCGCTEDLAVDHIKPRSLFPELALEPSNLQVLCRKCNSTKSNRTIVDYRHKYDASRI